MPGVKPHPMLFVLLDVAARTCARHDPCNVGGVPFAALLQVLHLTASLMHPSRCSLSAALAGEGSAAAAAAGVSVAPGGATEVPAAAAAVAPGAASEGAGELPMGTATAEKASVAAAAAFRAWQRSAVAAGVVPGTAAAAAAADKGRPATTPATPAAAAAVDRGLPAAAAAGKVLRTGAVGSMSRASPLLGALVSCSKALSQSCHSFQSWGAIAVLQLRLASGVFQLVQAHELFGKGEESNHLPEKQLFQTEVRQQQQQDQEQEQQAGHKGTCQQKPGAQREQEKDLELLLWLFSAGCQLVYRACQPLLMGSRLVAVTHLGYEAWDEVMVHGEAVCEREHAWCIVRWQQECSGSSVHTANAAAAAAAAVRDRQAVKAAKQRARAAKGTRANQRLRAPAEGQGKEPAAATARPWLPWDAFAVQDSSSSSSNSTKCNSESSVNGPDLDNTVDWIASFGASFAGSIFGLIGVAPEEGYDSVLMGKQGGILARSCRSLLEALSAAAGGVKGPHAQSQSSHPLEAALLEVMDTLSRTCRGLTHAGLLAPKQAGPFCCSCSSCSRVFEGAEDVRLVHASAALGEQRVRQEQQQQKKEERLRQQVDAGHYRLEAAAVYGVLKGLVKTTRGFGSVPTPFSCNNLDCSRLDNLSEMSMLLKGKKKGRMGYCGGCGVAVYCCKHCQQQDWEQRHKFSCSSVQEKGQDIK